MIVMLPMAVTLGAGAKSVAEAEGIAKPLTMTGPLVAVGASVAASGIGAARAEAMRTETRARLNFMVGLN